MKAPDPLKRLAEDQVRILEGGGCTAVFGIPFFAAGVFLLLVGSRAVPMGNSAEVPGWAWPVLVLMGLVFATVGGGLVFGRSWTTLDAGRRVILREWGLLMPMRSEEQSLHRYASIGIRFEAGDSDSSDRYPVVLKAVGDQAYLTIYSPTEYGQAFKCAAYLAEFLNFPLFDATTEHESVFEAEGLNDSYQERLRSRGEADEHAPQPALLRSHVDRSGGKTRIVIPGPDFRKSALLGLFIPAAIFCYVVPHLLDFFHRTHTPEVVQMFFVGFLILLFGIPPILGVLRSFLLARKGCTTVIASMEGIEIEERLILKTAKTWIPADEILDLDYTTSSGVMSASTSSARRLSRRSSESEWQSRADSVSESWWFKSLKRMAKSKGVIVKARGGMFTFAAGLPDEEVCYLHSVVKSALSGRSHASEGNLR